ncbi:MAG TPA: hypothetical protein VEA78_01725 [Acidimicrobiales bacterium]|nr:hypothetical protein [Acidimicrobiales bacterium]
MPIEATITADGIPLIPAGPLWTIHDVARHLRRSENTARKVARQPDAPKPVYVDGDGAVWDSRTWWDWTAKRAAADAATKRRTAAKTGIASGRSTRV